MSRFTQVPPFLHMPLAQRPERAFTWQWSPGDKRQRLQEAEDSSGPQRAPGAAKSGKEELERRRPPGQAPVPGPSVLLGGLLVQWQHLAPMWLRTGWEVSTEGVRPRGAWGMDRQHGTQALRGHRDNRGSWPSPQLHLDSADHVCALLWARGPSSGAA